MLHLRDDEDDLLNGYRLRSIIAKYSDHISLPILMPTEGDARRGPTSGRAQAGRGETEAAVNQASALWARPKSEISDQDYIEFYRHIASDYTDPLGLGAQQDRGDLRVHAAAVHPVPRPVRPVAARVRAGASGCTSGGSSSWRTPAS